MSNSPPQGYGIGPSTNKVYVLNGIIPAYTQSVDIPHGLGSIPRVVFEPVTFDIYGANAGLYISNITNIIITVSVTNQQDMPCNIQVNTSL